MSTKMNPLSNSQLPATTSNQVLRDFLAAWRCGHVIEAGNMFDNPFVFTDHALGLEFRDKQRLVQFLKKTYEFFPDTKRADEMIFSDEDCIVSEWTLTATASEPSFGGSVRQAPIRVRGISVLRISNGKISQWSDYYDQLTSRRSGLADWFAEWTEL